MYCIRCGKQIEDGSNYCMYCGAHTEQADRSVSAEESSDRMDDFEIKIPDDFMTRKAEPDDVEDLTYTRPVNRQDILDAMAYNKEEAVPEPAAAEPDDVEDLTYTRPVNRQDILDAMACKPQKQEEKPQDDVEDLLKKKKAQAAKQDILDALEAISKEQMSHMSPEEVPDIPIPDDFMEPKDIVIGEKQQEEPADESKENPWAFAPHAVSEKQKEAEDIEIPPDFTEEPQDIAQEEKTEEPVSEPMENPWISAPHAVSEKQPEEVPDIPIPENFMQAPPKLGEEDAPEDTEEQPLTRRGILTVVLVIVLLFSIAAGACISVMSGNIPVSSQSDDAGSAVADFQTQDSAQDE